MGRHFILRDGEVVEEPDAAAWARWYEEHYESVRLIARTEVADAVVTTEFLPIGMDVSRGAPPLLFETRVRGGWLDQASELHASVDEAHAGHRRWVEKIRAAGKDPSSGKLKLA